MSGTVHFDVVENLPKKTLVGYCSVLNSIDVPQYYDLLWYRFLERLTWSLIPPDRELYGVCANLNINGFFEYWTAVEARPGDLLPDDLIAIPMDAGTYGSRVEMPEKPLPVFYGQLTSCWETPSEYMLNWKQPFYEVYKPDWANRSAVKICVPLFASMAASEFQPLVECRAPELEPNGANPI
ncbi:MAG: GyrI-like domain-containing protein [Deltaproteobacteria bacterium]|jgi:predicted transcriptional regulator YdeE|nr:GyrI-like domain-containing protein [Deltaproteobacteria bacterium]